MHVFASPGDAHPVSHAFMHHATLWINHIFICTCRALPPLQFLTYGQPSDPPELPLFIMLALQVRNHILTKWRADVSRYLTQEAAADKILPKFKHIVKLAWNFLNIYGYINFGVAPALDVGQSGQDANKESVIVIGAGLAGTMLHQEPTMIMDQLSVAWLHDVCDIASH